MNDRMQFAKVADSPVRFEPDPSTFEILANTVPQLCFLADPDGSITWYNRRWCEYTGLRSEELLGWQWQLLHDPTLLPLVLKQWRASIEEEKLFDMVILLRGADQTYRHFLTRCIPVRGTDNRLLRWVGSCTDISELKQVESELRRTNAHLDLAIEVASLGEWELDLEQSSVTCSDRHAEIFGHPVNRDLWHYETFLNQVLPRYRPGLDSKVRRAVQGEPLDHEVRIRRLDGTIRWIWVRGRKVPETLNQPARLFGTVVDITERKQAVAKLRRSEKQLRALTARLQSATEAERLRIAQELHDQLGQALSGLKMELDWIVRKHGAARETWVGMVEESMKVIDSTISLVRNIATDLRPAMLDVFGLPAAIEWHMQQFQRRTGIDFTLTMPDQPLGLSDDQRIGFFRIFQEALTNIARHANAHHVGLTLERQRSATVMVVEDDGVGFDTNRLTATESLGVLGMSERALLMHAQLHLSSKPGNGTTLTLRMPCKVQKRTPDRDPHEDTHH